MIQYNTPQNTTGTVSYLLRPPSTTRRTGASSRTDPARFSTEVLAASCAPGSQCA